MKFLLISSSGFDADDVWGHRAGEPNKAVICSLALARLRTDAKPTPGDAKDSNAVGMAQKLLLFWRKPAVSLTLELSLLLVVLIQEVAEVLVGRYGT